MKTPLTASMEDYLEVIFQVIAEKEAVRPKDIARRLEVSGASVTGALRALADKGLIHYAPYDVITLTPAGKAAAGDVVRRHEVLRDFFVKILAVEEADADQAACRMEHSIPRGILERFLRFAEFMDLCPRAGEEWLSAMSAGCGKTGEDCVRCVSGVLKRLEDGMAKADASESVRVRDLKPGQKGRVLRITSRSAACRRMVEMGVTPGTLIEVERVAPLGDPVEIKVKGYHLSLRKDEAEGVEVERL